MKKQLLRNFAGLAVVRLLALPVGLATSILLARFLGPEEFGQYAFVMALVPVLALPVTRGLQNLLTREVAAYSNMMHWGHYRGVVRAAHCWVIIASLAILVLYAGLRFATDLVPASGKWNLLSIGILMLPFLGLIAVRAGVLTGLGRPVMAELPSALFQPVLMLCALAAAMWLSSLNAKLAILLQIATAAIAFFLATFILIAVRPSAVKEITPTYQLKVWAQALSPFFLLSLVSAFNANLGLIALGFLSTDEQIGGLRVAESGAQLVTLSLGLVNVIISPHIVRAFQSHDRDMLQQLSRRSSRNAFWIALSIATFLVVFGHGLLNALFGPQYADLAYAPLVILILGQLYNVFMGSVGYFLAMTGHERHSLKGHIAAVATNLILCIFLIPKFGATGAAIAISASVVVWNSVLAIFVYKLIGIRPSAY